MQALASSLLFSAAGWIAILQLVDFVLSARQKKQVRDFFTEVWFWLSNRTSGTYITTLRSGRAFAFFFWLAMIMIALNSFRVFSTELKLVAPELDAIESRAAVHGALMIVGAIILFQLALVFFVSRSIGPRIHAWMLSGTSIVVMLLKSVLVFVGFVIPAHIGIVIAGGTPSAGFSALSLLSTSLISVSQMIFPVAMVAILVGVYALVLACMMFVFRILEVFTARVVESEKGPVLAIAALLAIIAAIVTATAK